MLIAWWISLARLNLFLSTCMDAIGFNARLNLFVSCMHGCNRLQFLIAICFLVFQILCTVQKHILQGGPKRLTFTVPSLVFSALKVCSTTHWQYCDVRILSLKIFHGYVHAPLKCETYYYCWFLVSNIDLFSDLFSIRIWVLFQLYYFFLPFHKVILANI